MNPKFFMKPKTEEFDKKSQESMKLYLTEMIAKRNNQQRHDYSDHD